MPVLSDIKKFFLTGLLILALIPVLSAQSGTEFTFSATFAGSYKPLDSVRIFNLSRGCDTMLYGNDTVLTLPNVAVEQKSNSLCDMLLLNSWPNPSAGSFNLSVFTGSDELVKIIVADINGREILEHSIYLQTGYHRFIADIGNPGGYIVSVISSGQRRSVKILYTGNGSQVSKIRYAGEYDHDPGFRVENTGFTWFPGDDLRFVGYSSVDTFIPVHDVIEDDPVQSSQINFWLITGLPCIDEPFVTDICGNVYRTVKIGSQCWLRENLRTNRFTDGNYLPVVSDNNQWICLNTPAICWYENDSASNDKLYGAFYNWYAISGGNLCPKGWHIPTDAEWQLMEMFLGMSPADTGTVNYRGSDQGGMLKQQGTSLWSAPNTSATNASGFTALPAGKRSDGGGVFSGKGCYSYWWSSSAYTPGFIWYRILSYDNGGVFRGYHNKGHGYSVRCIRD